MVDSIGGGASSIQSILQNIRQIREEFDDQSIQGGIQGGLEGAGDSESHVSFQDTFKNAIQSVSDSQMHSAELKNAFEVGDPRVSLEQVTIASQQASLGFEAMLQVRNKLVDAYKEIMNMPV